MTVCPILNRQLLNSKTNCAKSSKCTAPIRALKFDNKIQIYQLGGPKSLLRSLRSENKWIYSLSSRILTKLEVQRSIYSILFTEASFMSLDATCALLKIFPSSMIATFRARSERKEISHLQHPSLFAVESILFVCSILVASSLLFSDCMSTHLAHCCCSTGTSSVWKYPSSSSAPLLLGRSVESFRKVLPLILA